MDYVIKQGYDKGADVAFWSPENDDVFIHYSIPVGDNLIIDVNRKHGIVGWELLHASRVLNVDRIRHNCTLTVNDAPPECPFQNDDVSEGDLSLLRRTGYKLQHKLYHFKTYVKQREDKILLTGNAAGFGIGLGVQSLWLTLATGLSLILLLLSADVYINNDTLL